MTAALLQAVNWNGEVRFTPEQLLAEPDLAHDISGWPRSDDFGVVATEDSADACGGDEVLGAAWCRLLDAADPGYGYLADDVPELTVGVASCPPRPRSRHRLADCPRRAGHRPRAHGHQPEHRGRQPCTGPVRADRFATVGGDGGSDTMRLDLRQ